MSNVNLPEHPGASVGGCGSFDCAMSAAFGDAFLARCADDSYPDFDVSRKRTPAVGGTVAVHLAATVRASE